MSTRQELNMEAHFEAGSTANIFDDLIEDRYNEDADFDDEDNAGEEIDPDEEIGEDDDQSKTSVLPITARSYLQGQERKTTRKFFFVS